MLIVYLVIALAAAGSDQLTKALIFGHDSGFIPGFICFRSTENRGMVWGLMNGVNWFVPAVSVVTLAVVGLIIFLIVKYRKVMHPLIGAALACVVGGAIGNLIDRVFLGFVRDFICTEFISFPVFNVADAFITCGAILLAVMMIFTRPGHRLIAAMFPEEDKKRKGEG
ncbi:MAG: signal peptidase II [Clostridia bacterium]|nr:signal peptidase II [Clostridia bacterium]